NLRVGGSGKTPVVASLARLLLERGHRPSILSRGYARRVAADGVTIVSDGRSLRAELAHAGDEPLMLARALSGVPVLVSPDRYAAGLLAERRFDVSIHLLDDGFQHFQLARTVDLVLVDEEDPADRLLPAGRLREPISTASTADALLVTGDAAAVDRVAHGLAAKTAFRVARTLGAPRTISGNRSSLARGARVFAVAGVARPDRFFSDLAAAGWEIAGSLEFGDHHRFTPGDVARIAAMAAAVSAVAIVTTEKDAVRLEACDLGSLDVAFV